MPGRVKVTTTLDMMLEGVRDPAHGAEFLQGLLDAGSWERLDAPLLASLLLDQLCRHTFTVSRQTVRDLIALARSRD